MKRLFILAAIAFTIVSCSKDKLQENDFPICGPADSSVTFKGIFERSTLAGPTASNVTITFGKGTFYGESATPNFPAIGNGAFEIKNEKIRFSNHQVWTADFDHNLILNGEYNFFSKGDTLIFTKMWGTDLVDSYRLLRHKRN